MTKFFLNCRAKWNRRKRMRKRKAQDAALEKFLDSPMFKKALAEVQAQRRERRLAERQQAEKTQENRGSRQGRPLGGDAA